MKDEAGFADRMNGILKYVVSETLENVEWNNSRLAKENIAEEISKLKLQPGKDILVAGSGKLVSTLMQHDLVDEYRLLVRPVVVGGGKRLFQNASKTNLNLVQAKTFSSGIVALHYEPAEKKVRK